LPSASDPPWLAPPTRQQTGRGPCSTNAVRCPQKPVLPPDTIQDLHWLQRSKLTPIPHPRVRRRPPAEPDGVRPYRTTPPTPPWSLLPPRTRAQTPQHGVPTAQSN